MEEFERIIKEIKEVKIQGANNIAIAGVKAFLLDPSEEGAKGIIATRPTEPLLQNAIKLLLQSKDKESSAIKFLRYMKESEKKTARYGEKLIKNDMNVFTHCHSTTVMEILKEAAKNGKKFVVYNTEAAPLYQGRKTAKELADFGIKVIHFSDVGMEQAIKNCDLFLFGADAFLDKGVVNKGGTSVLTELARLYRIPSYSCGFSLKYTSYIKIEFRPGKEVWDERNKNIFVVNPSFDFVNKSHLTGVISEFGVLNYKNFINKSKKHLKKFFS